MKEICPFCKSTNIQTGDEYIKKQEEKSSKSTKLSQIEKDQMHPIIAKLHTTIEFLEEDLKDYDPNEDEKYLEELELYGTDYVCLNCGHEFYEKVDYSDYENKILTEVSEAEFEKTFYSHLYGLDFSNPDVVLEVDLVYNLKKNFVKTFYKEDAEEHAASYLEIKNNSRKKKEDTKKDV